MERVCRLNLSREIVKGCVHVGVSARSRTRVESLSLERFHLPRSQPSGSPLKESTNLWKWVLEITHKIISLQRQACQEYPSVLFRIAI